MQFLAFLLTWPLFIIFIVIILLAACIVCVAVQDSRGSQPRAYVRASARDPWQPVSDVKEEARPWEPSVHQVGVLVCSCGKWNSPKESLCWNCRTSLANVNSQIFTFETAERCVVCSYWVYPGEPVVLCPSCQVQAHRIHLLEYLKAKGTCPVCKVKLNLNQLLNTTPILHETETELADEDIR